MTPTRMYRRMRRDGYSPAYSRHVVAGTTRHGCTSRRCQTTSPAQH